MTIGGHLFCRSFAMTKPGKTKGLKPLDANRPVETVTESVTKIRGPSQTDRSGCAQQRARLSPAGHTRAHQGERKRGVRAFRAHETLH